MRLRCSDYSKSRKVPRGLVSVWDYTVKWMYCEVIVSWSDCTMKWFTVEDCTWRDCTVKWLYSEVIVLWIIVL
jgi:hypothetical protein